MFGKPNKERVLNRWAESLGPQQNAIALLAHLGDKAIIDRFAPGEEPNWMEALAVLLSWNEHISVADVVTELRRPTPTVRELPIRRKGHAS